MLYRTFLGLTSSDGRSDGTVRRPPDIGRGHAGARGQLSVSYKASTITGLLRKQFIYWDVHPFPNSLLRCHTD
jgi:hypothetical protein